MAVCALIVCLQTPSILNLINPQPAKRWRDRTHFFPSFSRVKIYKFVFASGNFGDNYWRFKVDFAQCVFVECSWGSAHVFLAEKGDL